MTADALFSSALARYGLVARRISPLVCAVVRVDAEGYASRLPWPERRPGQIDLLVAGRRLRKANWVLLTETAPFVRPERVTDPALVAAFFARLEAEFREALGAASRAVPRR